MHFGAHSAAQFLMHSWLPTLSCWPTHHTSRAMGPSCERSESGPEESWSPCSLRTESSAPWPWLPPHFSASLSSEGQLHLESSDTLSAAPSSHGLSAPSGHHSPGSPPLQVNSSSIEPPGKTHGGLTCSCCCCC